MFSPKAPIPAWCPVAPSDDVTSARGRASRGAQELEVGAREATGLFPGVVAPSLAPRDRDEGLRPGLPRANAFDMVDLQLMVRVAESNSVTSGAAATHLSVPAASTRIKNLEQRLGTKLLSRGGHGVCLTPSGQTFVRHARLVLGQANELCAELRNSSRSARHHVRLFADPAALSDHLSALLCAYLADHPDVDIDLREGPSPVILRAVAEGNGDVGIVAGPARTANLEFIPFGRHRLVLVVPADHCLAGEAQVEFVETLHHQFVGLPESNAMQAFLAGICRKAHRPYRLRIQVGEPEMVCRMVEASIGIGVLPESAARRHARDMQIAVVPLSDGWATRELLVCSGGSGVLPALARKLVHHLREVAAGTLASSLRAKATASREQGAMRASYVAT